MWWQTSLLWGFWNGFTAWIVLIVHIFGGWDGVSVLQRGAQRQLVRHRLLAGRRFAGAGRGGRRRGAALGDATDEHRVAALASSSRASRRPHGETRRLATVAVGPSHVAE